ncbi:MAG: type III secretion system chaperone [Pseudomonadota bacterium]
MKLEELNDALAEIGPKIHPVMITDFEEELVTVLTFDVDVEILLERDENRELLVFVGTLGQTPVRAEKEMMRILMQMNNLWGALGGLRFALEEPGGDFVMLWDLPYPSLTTENLQNAIESFIDRIRFWRQVVADGRFESDDREIQEGDDNIDTMMRV